MMRTAIRFLGLVSLIFFGDPAPGLAQSFVDGAAQIPQGNPFNNSGTENVDFADIDGDGDYDAIFADGGDSADDQQPPVGQPGRPAGRHDRRVRRRDRRAVPEHPGHEPRRRLRRLRPRRRRGPLHLEHLDAGEPVEPLPDQPGRPAGRHGRLLRRRDQHALVNVGENDGSTTSPRWRPRSRCRAAGSSTGPATASSATSTTTATWTWCTRATARVFSGTVPSRLFLNDGAGFYEEFNPSGFQLSGQNIDERRPGALGRGRAPARHAACSTARRPTSPRPRWEPSSATSTATSTSMS